MGSRELRAISSFGMYWTHRPSGLGTSAPSYAVINTECVKAGRRALRLTVCVPDQLSNPLPQGAALQAARFLFRQQPPPEAQCSGFSIEF